MGVTIQIQDKDGVSKGSITTGVMSLTSAYGASVEVIEGAVRISAGTQYSGNAVNEYEQRLKDIVARTGAYAGLPYWLTKMGGAPGMGGALAFFTDDCLSAGGPTDAAKDSEPYFPISSSGKVFTDRTLRNICPPCVDCSSFRRIGDTAVTDRYFVEKNEDDELIRKAEFGVYDFVERLKAFLADRLSEIINDQGLLDKWKELVAMWNYVAHRSGLACKAEVRGKKIYASYKYTNYLPIEAGVYANIIYKDLPLGSRAYYIDTAKSVEDIVVSALDDYDRMGSNFELGSMTDPATVSTYLVIPPGETATVYTGAWTGDDRPIITDTSTKIRFEVLAPISPGVPIIKDVTAAKLRIHRPWAFHGKWDWWVGG
jgi:hypothetical protein